MKLLEGEWHEVLSEERKASLYKVGFFYLAGVIFGIIVGIIIGAW